MSIYVDKIIKIREIGKSIENDKIPFILHRRFETRWRFD